MDISPTGSLGGLEKGIASLGGDSGDPACWSRGYIDNAYVAVPAQPTDFQAEAESDTRIHLSWLLPPQERIIKYELKYWVAEEEEQQVSTPQAQPLCICAGPASPDMEAQLLGLWWSRGLVTSLLWADT